MSTSCGNPDTDKDAVMLRRPKFDKGKECIKCKTKTGNIVIRFAVYCKECFFLMIAAKFRRSLEPSINPVPDGPRRKAKASGNLLVGLSGGLGSTVLLDLVYQSYLSTQELPISDDMRKPKGGKDHPRHLSVWPQAAVCYVETCSAFQGMRDRTDEIRAVVKRYNKLDFISLRIEDAFSDDWWKGIGGPPLPQDLGIDVTNEDLFLSNLSVAANSPVSRLQRYISSLPTQTAIPNAIQTITRLLLLHTAMSTGSSHLLLGTSLTSLSISLISSISQGGGFGVREEAQEEWIPRISANSLQANGQKSGTIRVILPLRDIGMKECTIWAWWSGLNVVGRERFSGGKQSIGALTRSFIVGLERDYPSTASTIVRTCAKLAPKEGNSSICVLCERPAQSGIQDWKSQISVRSLKDPSHLPPLSTEPPSAITSLTPFLCYACHTTLTSRSSRGTAGTGSAGTKHSSVPLPRWVLSNVRTSLGVTEDGEPEGRRKAKMTSNQMEKTVADFLLDE